MDLLKYANWLSGLHSLTLQRQQGTITPRAVPLGKLSAYPQTYRLAHMTFRCTASFPHREETTLLTTPEQALTYAQEQLEAGAWRVMIVSMWKN